MPTSEHVLQPHDLVAIHVQKMTVTSFRYHILYATGLPAETSPLYRDLPEAHDAAMQWCYRALDRCA